MSSKRGAQQGACNTGFCLVLQGHNTVLHRTAQPHNDKGHETSPLRRWRKQPVLKRPPARAGKHQQGLPYIRPLPLHSATMSCRSARHNALFAMPRADGTAAAKEFSRPITGSPRRSKNSTDRRTRGVSLSNARPVHNVRAWHVRVQPPRRRPSRWPRGRTAGLPGASPNTSL
jgi:hypothetical protein